MLRARDALNRRETVLGHRRDALDALEEQAADLRMRQSQLRGQLGGWHRESSSLHQQMEGVQRDLAVWQERARLLSSRGDELQLELVELEVQAQSSADRVAHAQRDLSAAQEALAEQESLVAQVQVELDAHEEQRAELAQRVAETQARAIDLATTISDRRRRLEQIDERRATLKEDLADHLSTLRGYTREARELGAQLHSLADEQAQLQVEMEALAAEGFRLDNEMAESLERQAELRAELALAQSTAERLQTRFELLTRMRAEGEGLRAGVRAVLQAANRSEASAVRSRPNTLSGVLGTVAQLLDVPAEYELAIEVVLGDHLQDMVVRTWMDAEAAIAYLKERKAGRATFLPLDTVRSGGRWDPPHGPGVVGVAADLVEAEPHVTPVVKMLLGRAVVVRDLPAARRAFDQLRGGFQIVTMTGDILRSGGSVTGGQGETQVQGQILAREREWRELPPAGASAQSRCRELDSALADVLETEERLREQLAALSTRRREVEKEASDLGFQLQDLERRAEQINQQIAWRQSLEAQLGAESQELDTTEVSVQAELADLSSEKQLVEGQIAALQTEMDQLRGDVLYQRISDARTAAAVVRGEWDHRKAVTKDLQKRWSELRSQVEGKRQSLAALESEQKSLAQQVSSQASRETVLQGLLASLAEKIDPAEAEVARLEVARERLQGEETTLRARLREAESRHAKASLTLSRYEDRLQRLREQIMDDLGLVDMEPAEGLPGQPPLPFGELVSTLPVVETLPEGLEQEIHDIKAQLRRMGSVNPNAPDEYGDVLDRHTFLTTQAADLEEAAQGLREIIAELDDIMSREFQTTFKQVSAHFRENFTRLFGGGSARLLLTDPEDISRAGVEIVAQPPGRRQQTLALLSGGERSLTAVALIFALLEVSAPPFCILDEVDAMLDEANVRRFRQALEKLAEETQFIVITHNRRTIEAADTIYGVSMGDDSVSQVVSLRLEGDRIAAPDGTTVDVMKEA